MAITFSDMVNDVQAMLHGYVRTQEQSTHLLSSVTNSSSTLSVGDSTQMSRGVAEIDDELLWVSASDRTAATNQVTIPPYGRGYLGTTAASHAANAKITFSPMFPRVRVKRALNDTILAVGQDLFAVGVTTFTYTPNIVTYSLPTDSRDILQVSFDTTGPSQMWYPITRYRFDPMANVTDFANGKTIDIYEAVTSGRTVQVKYMKFPSELSADGDGFASVSGLLESSRDCIIYGAAASMTAGIDASILNTQAIEANVLDDRTQPGAGSNLSRQLYQLHKQRLAEERQRYVQQFPITFHYAR